MTVQNIAQTNETGFTHFKDGCFFIDGSGLSVIEECPTKGNLVLIRRRRRAGDDPALRLGRIVHEALSYRTRAIALGQPWSEEEQLKLLADEFAASPCENEEWRNLDFARQVIHHYNEEFALESPEIFVNPTDGQPVIEHSLAIDTGETILGWRIIYTGRIDDLRVKPEGLFVFDYKTTTMLGETWWQEKSVDEAQRGYCWAVKQSLGIEPCGYIIRALAFRKPTKTGTSIQFETQRFFTKEPAGQLDRWYQNMLAQCEQFLWHRSKGKFPFFHKSCVTRYNRSCDFFEVCNVNPSTGKYEEAFEGMLASGMFRDDDWSPLVGDK